MIRANGADTPRCEARDFDDNPIWGRREDVFDATFSDAGKSEWTFVDDDDLETPAVDVNNHLRPSIPGRSPNRFG